MMQTISKILFFIFTFVPLIIFADWQFTPQDVNALHKMAADKRIFYGNNTEQFADLRVPSNAGLHPVAIVVHGGCWISLADLENTAALADALREKGIATWNIEYRGLENGGGWPNTFNDVAAAADYLKNIAEQYSLDLNRVFTIGHSSGGHLALWLAARHKLPESSALYKKDPIKIKKAIILGGVPDLSLFRKLGEKGCGSDVVGKLLGASPEKIEQHYQEASPSQLLPLGVPQVLIYGANETAVPLKYASSYIKDARQKGDKVDLIEIPDAAHHEYNVPNSVTWPAIVAAFNE